MLQDEVVANLFACAGSSRPVKQMNERMHPAQNDRQELKKPLPSILRRRMWEVPHSWV